jgi:hypothetical protein
MVVFLERLRMQTVTDFLSAFPKMSMDHVNALIALGAMGLSAFAIYVVFAVVREQKRQ